MDTNIQRTHYSIERKQIGLHNAAWKGFASDNSGGFSGLITTWDFVDSVGDLILRGAYKGTAEQFIERGFITDSHSWDFAHSLGYPTLLKETWEGAYLEMKFFNTPDAQTAREKVRARMDQGLNVALSIGFEPAAPPLFIHARDYEKDLPNFVVESRVQEALRKAQKFPAVRILPQVHLYEVALVTVPAHEEAAVLAYKGTRAPVSLYKSPYPPALSTKQAAEKEAFAVLSETARVLARLVKILS